MNDVPIGARELSRADADRRMEERTCPCHGWPLKFRQLLRDGRKLYVAACYQSHPGSPKEPEGYWIVPEDPAKEAVVRQGTAIKRVVPAPFSVKSKPNGSEYVYLQMPAGDPTAVRAYSDAADLRKAYEGHWDGYQAILASHPEPEQLEELIDDGEVVRAWGFLWFRAEIGNP